MRSVCFSKFFIVSSGIMPAKKKASLGWFCCAAKHFQELMRLLNQSELRQTSSKYNSMNQ